MLYYTYYWPKVYMIVCTSCLAMQPMQDTIIIIILHTNQEHFDERDDDTSMSSH